MKKRAPNLWSLERVQSEKRALNPRPPERVNPQGADRGAAQRPRRRGGGAERGRGSRAEAAGGARHPQGAGCGGRARRVMGVHATS
eukprot:366356-Chlamydomonas_euryale.AAC.3